MSYLDNRKLRYFFLLIEKCMVIIELELVKGEVHPGAGFCPPPPRTKTYTPRSSCDRTPWGWFFRFSSSHRRDSDNNGRRDLDNYKRRNLDYHRRRDLDNHGRRDSDINGRRDLDNQGRKDSYSKRRKDLDVVIRILLNLINPTLNLGFLFLI